MKFKKNKLFEKCYVYDGYEKCNMDNLKHLYIRKYKLVTKNGKKKRKQLICLICVMKIIIYSRFLCNLIMECYYIQHFSFEKVSELLKLSYGLDIDYRRVCDLYNRTIEDFKLKKFEKVKEDIRNGKIKLGHVGNYDEEFVYVKHQPYVRLTLIDYKNENYT